MRIPRLLQVAGVALPPGTAPTPARHGLSSSDAVSCHGAARQADCSYTRQAAPALNAGGACPPRSPAEGGLARLLVLASRHLAKLQRDILHTTLALYQHQHELAVGATRGIHLLLHVG